MNDTKELDCFPYGTQFTHDKLVNIVQPLFASVQKWQSTTKKNMEAEWEEAYQKFMQQLKDDDNTVWEVMDIFSLQDTAMVVKEGMREYQQANGFVKMFMHKPDFDAGVEEITPQSKLTAIHECKNTLLKDLNVLASTERARLQKDNFNNEYQQSRVIVKFIFPLLKEDWIHKWWFINDIQRTVLTPLREMLKIYKDCNTTGDDICIIGDSIMRIIGWCNLNVNEIEKDENWYRNKSIS